MVSDHEGISQLIVMKDKSMIFVIVDTSIWLMLIQCSLLKFDVCIDMKAERSDSR
jgi:hypothetical protein